MEFVKIMDSSQYMKKCLNILNNDNFIKLTDNPTKSIEGKIQRAIRKIKGKLSKDEYNKIYPTGSAPGKMHGTAKVHKMAKNDNIDNLPSRPIISNIGTASHHLAKHLAKLLSLLSYSEFTVKNTKAFIQEFKNMLPPDDYKLISFDVTSLFTNALLDYTISIILKRIYDQRALETKILRKEMTDLLLLSTKNVHFSYDNKLSSQIDGVAMGSPLGPVIVGNFMEDLERNVIPKLSMHMTKWKRYVDDTK